MTSEFRRNATSALQQDDVQTNLNRVVHKLREHRQAAWIAADEWRQLRRHCQAIRENAVRKLPQLLEQLETNLIRNGIQVHWAETAEQANHVVLSIMQRHDAKLIIKGKSMVSEEIALNHFLMQHGIQALETDLGEFIIQLAGEKPAHIIVPALHKNRRQIAELLHRHFPGYAYTEDVDELAQLARKILRDHFQFARVGLTGVNFMIAESGTLCLVENEGNGRMCSTIPPVHIAVTGIEKVVEKLSDIPPLLSILTRSATGQPITTYFNMISAPRQPGEKDGPREVHVVLLDNGRSTSYRDRELAATLRCIRCAACINHCPVYQHIGGHAYGTVIPGPIGSILEPQQRGLDRYGELTQASTLCGACTEVCPVGIPIADILNRLRWDATRQDADCSTPGAGSGYIPAQTALWKLWAWQCTHPGAYRLSTRLATRLRVVLPGYFDAWTNVRTMPKLAKTTLHERLKALGIDHE